jgi:hypothetical protein
LIRDRFKEDQKNIHEYNNLENKNSIKKLAHINEAIKKLIKDSENEGTPIARRGLN